MEQIVVASAAAWSSSVTSGASTFAVIGIDIAKIVREYFIPDLSDWKTNHDTYQQSFEKVVASLKSADAAVIGGVRSRDWERRGAMG